MLLLYRAIVRIVIAKGRWMNLSIFRRLGMRLGMRFGIHFGIIARCKNHFIHPNMSDSNPCTHCGACCAYFRVSFYWGETCAHPNGSVPVELTEPVSPYYVAMRGTNQVKKRCVALSGEVGKEVSCTIYAARSSSCHECQAGDARCNRARRAWGMAEIDAQGLTQKVCDTNDVANLQDRS